MIYLAVRDPRVPAGRKVAAIIAVVLLTLYIINPLDIIPDVVPFLGGLIDDLLVIPIGTWATEKLLPRQVVKESRAEAARKLKPFTVVINVIAAVLLGFAILVIAGIIVLIVLLVQRIQA